MGGHRDIMFEDFWANYAKLCDHDCFRAVCPCSSVIHLLLLLSMGKLVLDGSQSHLIFSFPIYCEWEIKQFSLLKVKQRSSETLLGPYCVRRTEVSVALPK